MGREIERMERGEVIYRYISWPERERERDRMGGKEEKDERRMRERKRENGERREVIFIVLAREIKGKGERLERGRLLLNTKQQ